MKKLSIVLMLILLITIACGCSNYKAGGFQNDSNVQDPYNPEEQIENAPSQDPNNPGNFTDEKSGASPKYDNKDTDDDDDD